MADYTEDLCDSDVVEITSTGRIVAPGTMTSRPSLTQMKNMGISELRIMARSHGLKVNKYWNRGTIAEKLEKKLSDRERFGVRPPKHTFYAGGPDTPPFSHGEFLQAVEAVSI